MPAVYLTDSNNNILAIDATITESRSFSAKISSKPVEDGSSISDTKILENPSFSIEGIVTNTPTVLAQKEDVTITPDFSFLGNAGQFFNFDTTVYEKIKVAQVQANGSPVLNAYTFLKRLYESSKPFSVQISGYDELKNVLIKNLKFDFNSDDGDCLHFTIDFKQIKIVSSKKSKVPQNTAQSKVSEKNTQGNIQPKPIEVSQSWFSNFFGIK